MNLLPTCIGRLVNHTHKNPARFALNGVQIKVSPDGRFQAAATDGKQLLVLEGNGEVGNYPTDDIPALALAPNSATSSLVPGDRWKSFFDRATKHTKGGGLAALRKVPIVLGEKVTTFGATKGNGDGIFEEVKNLEGRFPPVEDIFPRSKPVAKLRVDARLLKLLCETAAAMMDDEPFMDLEFQEETPDPDGITRIRKPVVIRYQAGDVTAKGVIMPVTQGKPSDFPASKE